MSGPRVQALPPNNLALHDMFASVLSKIESGEGVEDTSGEDQHVDDLFHPENIFNRHRNFPTPANSRMARLKATQLQLMGKEEDAARLLLLAQANLFQHQFQLQYAKRLAKKTDHMVKKMLKNDLKEDSENGDSEESFEEKQKRLMLFSSFEDPDLLSRISELPPTWTVVQVGVTEDPLVSRFKVTKKDIPGDTNPDLLILRLARGKVTLRRCPGPDSTGFSPYMKELSDILAENTHVNRNVKVKTKYWQIRTDLDNRLTALVSSIQETWLGANKWMLLGQLSDPKDVSCVEQLLREQESVKLEEDQVVTLSAILSASPFMTNIQLSEAISSLLPQESQPCISAMVEAATERLGHLASARRHPIILICDPSVQTLPWESLPCLTKCHQAASRVPSFPFLYTLWQAHSADKKSVVSAGLAAENVFYVVNPDSSLPETQKRLDKAFQEWKAWEGLAGEAPSKDQLQQVLQAKDCFMYCGHGSGSQYLSRDEVERLRVRAVPLLLGCSSGRLERLGRMVDPLGTAQSYLMAASPALLGFLWSVTDLDVDKWTLIFLAHWLGGQGEPRLLQAAADVRGSFKSFTNSCALVMYGLPLSAKVS